ncbi:unnamed protein product, partial [Coccothraustes coccothraustes]
SPGAPSGPARALSSPWSFSSPQQDSCWCHPAAGVALRTCPGPRDVQLSPCLPPEFPGMLHPA